MLVFRDEYHTCSTHEYARTVRNHMCICTHTHTHTHTHIWIARPYIYIYIYTHVFTVMNHLQVTPIYYVFFTTFVITASVILFKDWKVYCNNNGLIVIYVVMPFIDNKK